MRSKKPIYILVIVCLPILFVLQYSKVHEPLRDISLSALKPFFVLGNSLVQGVRGVENNFMRFLRAFKEQKEDQARIEELESKIAYLTELEKENERLRKLFDFSKTLPQKFIAARVIGWDPSPWRKMILLDKGKKDGIKPDMAIVVSEGLVGRVMEVTPSASRVILLVDPDARVSSLASDSRAQGITGGEGSSTLTMSYLELESGVHIGETVMSSGMTQIFPKGIPIGKILSLERDASGLHLSAKIEPFVDFSKLEEVLCLIP